MLRSISGWHESI